MAIETVNRAYPVHSVWGRSIVQTVHQFKDPKADERMEPTEGSGLCGGAWDPAAATVAAAAVVVGAVPTAETLRV